MAQEWISTEDRMPSGDDNVLVWGCGFIEIGWYSTDLRCWQAEDFNYDEGEVTHWMPLPAPPKEG